jgi:predicted P-loop ATPase
MVGGGKFDYMMILTGPQGKGKSTFISKLAGKWFSDSLVSFDGKEAMELIQGTWINEVAELNAFNRSEVAAIKQFLSKQDDYYRPAYGRKAISHPRRCILIGSSNSDDYLRDATGNRRFWPIDIWITEPELSVFEDLDKDRDQIWAEAVKIWKAGEKLYLTGDAAKIAIDVQECHREVDAREGRIVAFVAMDVPENWNTMPLAGRRFWLGQENHEGETLVPRDRICAAEVWCEILGGDLRQMKRQDAKDINAILGRIPGWKKSMGALRFGSEYGVQKGFVKA